jgi:hypothetical protein
MRAGWFSGSTVFERAGLRSVIVVRALHTRWPMLSTKTASVASRLATFLLVVGCALGSGCGSGTLNPDGGSGGGGHQAGAGGDATGPSTGGDAGSKTGQAGTSGTAGSSASGAAGTHGANDGGPADKGGLCACAAIYEPVCGADGKTYPSRCDADCAGVVVAHDGVCAAPAKDAGADGPLGHCDQDTECQTRPAASDGCSCAQVCAAKTDPQPPPPKFRCGIVCPAIAISCTCVNHLCTAAASITSG